MRRYYRKIDEQLRDNRFIAGARFSVADITTLCSVDFARAVEMPIPADCSGVARWHEEVSARPSARRSL